MMASISLNVLLTVISIAIFSILILDLEAQGQRQGAKKAQTTDSQQAPGFRSPCGSEQQVAAKVGRCLDPIYEVLEGKVAWPTGDKEMVSNCDRFTQTEKCVRSVAKDCLEGVHKTAVGAIASAAKRFRAQECKSATSRAKYSDPLKCLIQTKKDMVNELKNHTGIAQGIRDLNVPVEERLVAACCLFDAMDRSIEMKFKTICPKNIPLMLGLIHAMTDDAKSTLCVRPKCNGVLDGVSKHPYKSGQNFVEPIMQIVFAL